MKTVSLSLLLVLALASCKAPAGGPPEGDWAMRSVLYQIEGQEVVDDIEVVGTLYANESVELRSEVSGRMEKIHFEEGEQVKKGELLFEVDATKLLADVNQSKANFNLAKADLDRSQDLFKKRTISSQEFDQAKAEFQAREAELARLSQLLREARVEAPFDGFLGSRRISPGQYISVGDSVTSLVSADPIKLEFEVPERYLARLAVGQTVNVTVAPFPGKTFKAEVYFISPQIDIDSRTAQVKALIDNPDARLRPGMFANLKLVLDVRADAVVIPQSAIMYSQEGQIVYLVTPEYRVKSQEIQAGKVLSGRVEILSGLSIGDVIVIEGMQKLSDGSLVEAAPDSNISDQSYFSEGA